MGYNVILVMRMCVLILSEFFPLNKIDRLLNQKKHHVWAWNLKKAEIILSFWNISVSLDQLMMATVNIFSSKGWSTGLFMSL